MGLVSSEFKLVIHVGGLYKDKRSSLERFKENFIKLPNRIKERIMLENDDKSYTAKDVSGICNDLNIPMVLDVHHHQCVNNGETLDEILPLVFDTWKHQKLPPKIHFSSPKNKKDFRSHADNIECDVFRDFLDTIKKTDLDFDVMLEAKNKDSALIKLSSELEKFNDLEKINLSTFRMI
jgi:UV DNA damage endonuclease